MPVWRSSCRYRGASAPSVVAASKPPDEPSDGPLATVAGGETETKDMKTYAVINLAVLTNQGTTISTQLWQATFADAVSTLRQWMTPMEVQFHGQPLVANIHTIYDERGRKPGDGLRESKSHIVDLRNGILDIME